VSGGGPVRQRPPGLFVRDGLYPTGGGAGSAQGPARRGAGGLAAGRAAGGRRPLAAPLWAGAGLGLPRLGRPGGRACLAGRQTLVDMTKGCCTMIRRAAAFACLYLAEDGGAVGQQDGGTGADDLAAPPQAGGDAVAQQPPAAFGQGHGGLLAGGVV